MSRQYFINMYTIKLFNKQVFRVMALSIIHFSLSIFDLIRKDIEIQI